MSKQIMYNREQVCFKDARYQVEFYFEIYRLSKIKLTYNPQAKNLKYKDKNFNPTRFIKLMDGIMKNLPPKELSILKNNYLVSQKDENPNWWKQHYCRATYFRLFYQANYKFLKYMEMVLDESTD